MAKKQPKFSMRPEMGEDGIFGSNVDATITEATYTTWDDAGENALKGGREANDPCAKITFQTEDGEDHVQYFSAGKGTRLCPSEDGEEAAESGPFIIPVEDSPAKSLNKQTNIWAFLNSLCKPASGKLVLDSRKLDEVGLEALVGMRVHLVRVPAANQGPQEEGARERTIIVCNEIYELGPQSGKGKKGAESAGKTGKPGPKAVVKKGKDEDEDDEEDEDEDEEEESDDDSDPITTEAQAIVVKALAKSKSGIEKDNLPKTTFNEVAKSKNRKAILALFKDDDFVSDGPWEYNAKTETLTSAE